jgi:hypothetical protein
MKNSISLSDKTAAEVAKLAEVFGVSNDECVERLLSRFVFNSLEMAGNEIIAEEVEQLVCEDRSRAAAMAKRLEAFAIENRKTMPANGASGLQRCGTATDGGLRLSWPERSFEDTPYGESNLHRR